MSEFQCVVFVGRSFDVTPFSSVFVGGADESFVSEADGQVVEPAGWPASFHDDNLAFGFLEERREVVSFGGGIAELMFLSF